jgi:hypothetical protein
MQGNMVSTLAHVVYFNHDEGRTAVGIFFDKATAQKFQKKLEAEAEAEAVKFHRLKSLSPSEDHYSTHAEYVMDRRHTGISGISCIISNNQQYVYAAIDTLDTFFHHMERIKAVYSTAYAANAWNSDSMSSGCKYPIAVFAPGKGRDCMLAR